MSIYDINGNEITGGSGDVSVSNLSIYQDDSGSQREGYLTYGGHVVYPITHEAQRLYKKKVYNGGTLLTIGDSYTSMGESYFDTFASAHGLTQYNLGLASSKIARPEGQGQDTIRSFVTRLDALISDATFDKTAVKLITFMGGANDWTTVSDTINRIGDRTSTDVAQIYGACKYIFGTLLTTFPNADVIVILQPNNANNADAYIMEWKESIVKECAEMYQLPICDCCFNFYSPFNPVEKAEYWKDDNLHLTTKGYHALIARLETTLNSLSYYKAM